MPRLIDADALKDSVKETYCDVCNSCNRVKCRACNLDDAMSLIDDAPTVPTFGEWVSVKERLPENGQIVLVRQAFSRVRNEEGAEITIGAYNARPEEQTHPYWEFQHYRNDMRDRTIMDNSIICPGNEYVTHWMPLPCMPKEGKDDA